jgi:hypothetical protein
MPVMGGPSTIIDKFLPPPPSLRPSTRAWAFVFLKMDAKLQVAPRLKLLLEFEPAHRVFFRNLTDALLRRQVPRVPLTSRPGPFWNDVFVYSAMPWRSFFESILWHVFVVAVIWTVFLRGGPRLETARQQQMFHDSRITYYAPSKSFPATESRRVRPRPQPKAQREIAHQQKIRVAPERTAHTLIMPPDLMQARSRRLDAAASKVVAANPTLPAMPLSATGRLRRAMPAGVASAVAPSPEMNQASARRPGLPQTSAIAPAPEVGAGSSRRTMAAPNSSVIAPAPTVQGSMRRVGDVNIGHSEAVAPAPALPMQAQGSVSGMAKKGLGGLSASVVPPPPTMGGATANGRGSPLSGIGTRAVPPAPLIADGSGSGPGGRAKAGRANSLSTASPHVVGPAPSVEGGSGSGNGRRASSLSGGGSQVVPPAPSLGGGGDLASNGGRNSLSGGGLQAVPPAPSVDGNGGLNGGGRRNSLAGSGMQAVPPAPSIGDGGDSDGSGRRNSLGTDGGQAVPPAPSVDSAGSSGGNGSGMGSPAVAPPQQAAADDHHEQAVQELPVNLIGLVLALPGTSYFSNYEVFVARRRTSQDATVLIKLVYEFLPYQKRLSDYDMKNTKVYKLTVVRDATCDETLAQMFRPQIDEAHPGKQYTLDPAVLGPNNPNAVLMCYRTTADEFRKSITKAR